MAKITGMPAGEFARALGIEDPNNVRRILVDVCSGEATRIYVERFLTDDAAPLVDAMHALMTGERIGEPVAMPEDLDEGTGFGLTTDERAELDG